MADKPGKEAWERTRRAIEEKEAERRPEKLKKDLYYADKPVLQRISEDLYDRFRGAGNRQGSLAIGKYYDYYTNIAAENPHARNGKGEINEEMLMQDVLKVHIEIDRPTEQTVANRTDGGGKAKSPLYMEFDSGITRKNVADLIFGKNGDIKRETKALIRKSPNELRQLYADSFLEKELLEKELEEKLQKSEQTLKTLTDNDRSTLFRLEIAVADTEKNYDETSGARNKLKAGKLARSAKKELDTFLEEKGILAEDEKEKLTTQLKKLDTTLLAIVGMSELWINFGEYKFPLPEKDGPEFQKAREEAKRREEEKTPKEAKKEDGKKVSLNDADIDAARELMKSGGIRISGGIQEYDGTAPKSQARADAAKETAKLSVV